MESSGIFLLWKFHLIKHISIFNNMKKTIEALLFVFFATMSLSAFAQVENAGTVRKRTEKEQNAKTSLTERLRNSSQTSDTHDADVTYMKEVYRNLDLGKVPNAALYYPEDVIDGQENLFRIIFRLVLNGQIPAYEYLDGREIFTDEYKIKVGDALSRFDIYAQEVKGSTEKSPKFIVEEADVPAGQVLNYYIIEKWEFDRRSSSMKTIVEAICPVLNKYGDYGSETLYPMFWVKMDDLQPYLQQQYIAINDDNNLPQYSLNDFFTLGLYDGEIYKTRNLRNLSMAQMYPDEDDRKKAQDSIDNQLRNYGKDLWVPSREEYLAKKESEKNKKQTEVTSDEIPEKNISELKGSSSRAKKKSTNNRKSKVNSSANVTPDKSVRRRKK